MDRGTFEEQYKKIYQDMYRFALYTLGHCQDAEDVVSEAVADAWNGCGKLRNDESFRPWIFKILTAKCKRKLKEYLHKTVDFDENIQEMIGNVSEWNVEEAQDVRDAFLTLDGQERLIVSMSVFGGYNSREIGKCLFLKDNTVRSKLARALEKMQKRLDG